MEIEGFSFRPIDTIDLNFYDCTISFLQAQGQQMEALKKRCLIIPARVQSAPKCTPCEFQEGRGTDPNPTFEDILTREKEV